MKKNHHRLILLIAGFQFLALGLFAQTILFTPTDSAGTVAPPDDSTIIKSINIKINNGFLSDPLNKKFLITLPEPGKNPGILVSIVSTRLDQNPKFNSYSLYAKLENEPGSFVLLTQIKNVVSGYIRTEKNQLYRISYIGNNLHRISKINQQLYKSDRADNPPTAVLSANADKIAKSGKICNDAVPGGVIDVLVCYTAAAKRSVAGGRSIETEILNAVNLTNQSYINSQITHRIELTSMVQVPYTESRVGPTDRDRLQNPGDGYLDIVHSIRDTESADIVVLLVADPGPYTGVAYIMETPSPAFESWAFCVVKLDDASVNHAFAHEIGHLMGAEHDCEFDDGSPISHPFSHGYRSGAFKTIMSVNALGTRVEYWANNSVSFPGTSVLSGGVRGGCEANDHQTIANGFDIVSKFRCKNPGPEPKPPTPTPTPSDITIEPNPSTTPTPSDITIEPEPDPVPTDRDGRSSISSPYSWIIVSISLLIVSFFILFFWRRRKRDREIKK